LKNNKETEEKSVIKEYKEITNRKKKKNEDKDKEKIDCRNRNKYLRIGGTF